MNPPFSEEFSLKEKVSAWFLKGGGLSQIHPGFRERKEQVEMARTVTDLFLSGGIGLIEAGTGVGKTLAYLYPAWEFAKERKERIVISTSTLALQDQILKKELEILKKADPEFTIGVFKGRHNYLSLRRYELFLRREEEQLFSPEIETLKKWVSQTVTGEWKEISSLILESLWEEVESEYDNCLRGRCPFFLSCFYFQSRREGEKAPLLLVNHALLSLDLALRSRMNIPLNEEAVLPPYHHLIVDEAHALWESLKEAFGLHLSYNTFSRNLLFLYHPEKEKGALKTLQEQIVLASTLPQEIVPSIIEKIEEGKIAVEEFRSRVEDWFSEIDRLWEEREAWDLNDFLREYPSFSSFPDFLMRAYEPVENAIEPLFSLLRTEEDRSILSPLTEVESRYFRIKRILELLSFLWEKEDVARFLEKERENHPPAFIFYPLDLTPSLSPLWNQFKTVLFLSATLGDPKENYRFFREKTGIDSPCKISRWESPFNYYERVSLLVVKGVEVQEQTQKKDSPLPHDLSHALLPLLLASSGRTLILSTRTDWVQLLGEELRIPLHSHGIPLFVQKTDGTPSSLLEGFLLKRKGVLIGTGSFWTGVDLPSGLLRQVIVLKLPFPVPTHPYYQALSRKWEREGENPFLREFLPLATLRFRQGFGRLMRDEEGFGVVTVLDERILTKGYGKEFLKILPPIKVIYLPPEEGAEWIRNWIREKEGDPL